MTIMSSVRAYHYEALSSCARLFFYLNMIPFIFFLLSVFTSANAAYTWPSNQYDALEQLLYEGTRSDGSSLASIVSPCRKRTGTLASIPAEWLRFVRIPDYLSFSKI